MTKEKLTELAQDNIGRLETLTFEGWELCGDIADILDVPVGKITGHDLTRIGQRLERFQRTLEHYQPSEEEVAFRKGY